MRFFGNIEAKTDSKGRVFLPAVFRRVLGSAGEVSLVMRKDILVTVDMNGRFLIPKRYLKMANIGQSIQFKGMDDTIEIWGQQEEEKAQMSSEEFSQSMEKLMGTTNSVFDEW